jgi:hypothetical protein
MLEFPEKMSRPFLSLAVFLVLLSVARGSDRWVEADELEDADLVVFFTGELRGYVEPCG